MKRTVLLWTTVLVLGWLFDFLFWGHAPGINFGIYAVLCLLGGSLVLILNGYSPSRKTIPLLVPILFFAFMTFIRQEPLSIFLSLVFTLGLMSLLAVTWIGGQWIQFGLADYVLNILKLALSMIARPLTFLAEVKKTAPAESRAASGSRAKRFWAIFRGVLIAIPIIVIFAALLSSADLVFAQRVQDFTRLFRLENLPQYIFRCIYIAIVAYALAGVYLHAAQKSNGENLLGLNKPLVTPFLGFTEATIVLGGVVILFSLFAAVQFRYFFGGLTNIGIQGFTYAEYARRGFSELVAVSFFSLLLFLGLSAIVKREGTTQRWVFSGLGVGMVALVGVMLLSAFQRMLLYEAAYGFSRLRIYTHVFMIWLAILLVGVVVLELIRRERTFALAILLSSIGFAATLVLINVDATIVRQNVARTSNGNGLDVAYLASLSTDSIPALVTEFQDPTLLKVTHEAVGAALVCYSQNSTIGSDNNWRGFTLSSWQAVRALKRIQNQLDQYQAGQNDYSISITTPSGDHYDCTQAGGM